MSEPVLLVLRSGSWVVTSALCYLCAPYSSYPRFDSWFFGVAFVLNLIFFAMSIFLLRER